MVTTHGYVASCPATCSRVILWSGYSLLTGLLSWEYTTLLTGDSAAS